MRSDGRKPEEIRPVTMETGFVRYPEGSVLYRAGNTVERGERDVKRGRPSGRSQEIQRLIGRSLRAAVRRDLLGERTLAVDCDVIQADGSTRTASISGGWVATVLALARMHERGQLYEWPLVDQLASVAVGLVGQEPRVDLDYGEDFECEVDLNLVFTADGRLVEIQGTAEGKPFTRTQLDAMLDVGWLGAQSVIEAQRSVVVPVLEGLGLALA